MGQQCHGEEGLGFFQITVSAFLSLSKPDSLRGTREVRRTSESMLPCSENFCLYFFCPELPSNPHLTTSTKFQSTCPSILSKHRSTSLKSLYPCGSEAIATEPRRMFQKLKCSTGSIFFWLPKQLCKGKKLYCCTIS